MQRTCLMLVVCFVVGACGKSDETKNRPKEPSEKTVADTEKKVADTDKKVDDADKKVDDADRKVDEPADKAKESDKKTPDGPSIRFEVENAEWRLEATGFPVVSEDGSQVLVAAVAPDGQRGELNLTIHRHEGSGVAAKRWTILDADKFDDARDEPKKLAKLKKNAELNLIEVRKIIANNRWKPLTEVEVSRDMRDAKRQSVKIGELEVLYAGQTLWGLKNGRDVFRLKSGGLKDKSGTVGDCGPARDLLWSVYHDASRPDGKKVFLALIDYESGTHCPAPDPAWRLFRVGS